MLESRRASKGEEIYTSQLEAVREETWLKDMVRREADLVRWSGWLTWLLRMIRSTLCNLSCTWLSFLVIRLPTLISLYQLVMHQDSDQEPVLSSDGNDARTF